MVDVAALSVKIDADTTGLESGLQRAHQSVTGLGSSIVSAFGGAAVAGVAALGVGLVGAAKSAMDFEKQMSAVSAVSGASASEMQALTSAALQLGKDTSFSAKEAATGIEELVKAGVSIGDVLGGAGRAALDLAAAGAISVGDAAEIAANAMNVFNKDGTEMAHIADMIAGAANASAITVNDYKFSLSSAGAVAATIGIEFDDLTVAIAAMGNAGIKGSDAGTSLKTMMLNLSPASKAAMLQMQQLGIVTLDNNAIMEQAKKWNLDLSGSIEDVTQRLFQSVTGWKEGTEVTAKQNKAWADAQKSLGLTSNAFFDGEGKVKSFRDISEILKTSLVGLTREQQINAIKTIFGTDAIRAAAILAQLGAEKYDELAAAIGKVTAQSVANERLNNLAGSLEKLKGSLETGAIILGGMFTPALKEMADAMTTNVNAGIDALEQIPDVIATIKQVLAGEWAPDSSIRPFTLAVGEAAVMLRDRFGPAVTVVGAFITGTLIPAIQQLAAPVAAFIAGFAATAVSAALVSAAIGAVASVLALLLSPLGLVAIAVGLLAAAWTTNFMGIQEATAAAWAAMLPTFTALVDWLGVQIPLVLNWISTVGWPALVAAGQVVADWIMTVAIPAITQLVDWLGPQIMTVLTWITTTGWPALVAAGQAVSEWITGTAIPAITQLVEWLGPKIQEVTTWISGTGWPALVTAGVKVGEMIAAVIKFFQGLYVELEKRGVFTELQQIWTRLEAIGVKLAPAVQKIGEVLATVFEWVSKLVATAVLPALVIIFGQLETSTTKAGGPIGVIATVIEKFVGVISTGLAAFEAFVGLMERLSKIKQPEYTQPPGIGDGGSSGSPGQQSFTPLRNIEQMNTAALYSGPTGSVAQVNQMKLGLSNADAIAACGPAALDWFRQQTGRNPDAQEAMRLAKAAGWTAARGMAGPGSFSAAAAAAGIPNQLLSSPTDADLDRLARSGQPFAISTGEHYYQVQGGSAAGLNVGASGTVLGGGAPTMSAADIRARGYPIQAAIVPDIPAPKPPPASVPSGAFTGGSNAEKTMPGAFPEQWPGFMQQVDEQLPAYLTSLETIQQSGIQTFAAVATGAVTSGAGMTSMTRDDLGNIVRMYQENGLLLGMTVTNAAGEIMRQWGTMGATVVATNAATNAAVLADTQVSGAGTIAATVATGAAVVATTGATGAMMISMNQDSMGNVTRVYTEAGQVIAATVTDTGGKIVTTWTTTGAEVVSASLNALGGQTTVFREKSGEMVTIVTEASGRIVQQFSTAGKGAEEATKGIDTFKSSLGSIKPPNLSAIVKEFEKVEKAAKQAWEAGQKIGEGMAGGKKSGSGGDSGLGKGKAAGGPVEYGTVYPVGERGPELFAPWADGHIIPNHALGGDGGEIDYDRLARAIASAVKRPNVSMNVHGRSDEIVNEVMERLAISDAMSQRGGW